MNSLALWNRGKYWLFITVVIVVVLYPLSLFHHIPKWDSVRGYLPYRFFVSDYVNDGHLPLWNPFQRLGYPGYADLQSGCWYPIVWLLLLLGQYDITTLIVEVVLCFLIAGWGMFTLSSWMHKCNRTAVIVAISYALSGCMVGSAQLMVFLIGMAWLPWIVWAWLRMLQGGGVRYAALLSFFLMCNITGASPAFTIVLLYALPAIGVWHGLRSNNKAVFLRHIGFHLLITFTLLVMLLAPFLVAFVDFMPYFNRTGKLPYEDMIINPFVWSDYISFLFPYSVISTHQMFEVTDLSLRNAYVGFAGILFFLAALFQAKSFSKWFWGLVLAAVVAMWLALGDFSGIYRFTYHLPGFGLFRHPAFFRGYGMLCILLLAGFVIPKWINGEFKVPLSRLVFGVAVVGAVGAWAWTKTQPDLVLKTIEEIGRAGEFPSHGFASQLLVNVVVLLFILFLVALLARLFSLSRFASLLLFVAFDMMVQTRLSAPTTLYHAVDFSQTASYFEEIEKLPAHDQSHNTVPLKYLDESSGLLATTALEKNISTYNRRISSVGENPLRFKAFDEAKDQGSLQWVIENPLMYFPFRVCLDGDSIGPGCLFRLPVHLDNIGTECTLSAVEVGYNMYSAVVLNPTEDARWLVLNANFHHLWSAELEGKTLPIERVNHLAMGVLIPPDSSGVVRFNYESPALPWAILLAAIGCVVLVVIVYKKRGEA